MKNTNTLTRSTAFWLLLLISFALTGIGGWLVTSQVTSMTSTLLAGTATNVDVYVGQSLVVFGAAILGAGLLGILLSLVLAAVKALLPKPAAEAAPAESDADSLQDAPTETAGAVEAPEAAETPDADAAAIEEREPSIAR